MFSLVAGSVTTYQGKPPNFDVIAIDPVSMLPINIETEVFNLEYANKYDVPKWYVGYNWK